MPTLSLGSVPLAATGEAAKSGPLGLAVILFFCVACYFLFKSMSKHLRKVRDEFPVDSNDAPSPPDAGPVATSTEPAADAARVDPTGPDVEPPVQANTDTERPTTTS